MSKHSLDNFLDDTLTFINSSNLSDDEIVQIATEVMDNIRYDSEDYHLSKIDAIFTNLLSRGLNLNKNHNGCIFDDCIWIENYSISLMLMKKFLDYGANPNLIDPEDDESLYEYINFAVGYDMFNDEKFISIWILLIAYGGHSRNGKTDLVMKKDFSYEIFKDIDKFSYCIDKKESGYHMMYIFNKATKEIVASYEKHWDIS